jgi:hypothetical protein
MGIAPESAGSLRTCSHEVRKTREYLPSDGPLPTPLYGLQTRVWYTHGHDIVVTLDRTAGTRNIITNIGLYPSTAPCGWHPGDDWLPLVL